MTLSEWKGLDLTEEILREFRRRQAFLKEQLAATAGENARADGYKCGAIAAYEDVLNIELDEETRID